MSGKSDLEDLRTAIRDAGLRATPSRIATLRVLREADHPMSHAEVLERLGTLAIDQATVYRNLSDFVGAGIATRTDIDHIWRFETPSEKHVAETHPHFVCSACGVVECLPELEFITPRAKTPRAVKQRKIEIHVRGLCDGCA